MVVEGADVMNTDYESLKRYLMGFLSLSSHANHAVEGVSSFAELDPLTPREFEILQLLAQGHTNNEIAKMLFITPGTVKGHVHHLFSKLSVRNRTEAVTKARSLNLLAPVQTDIWYAKT
jgi:ATP/maltotriose-dependent transcriptional regulator MalT